ncbi:MAG: DUF1553 domain-containing protein [Planctomycetaceae bacterium]
MFAKAATVFLFLTGTLCFAFEPPSNEQSAVDALTGIASNIQTNRDGTVRFVRFSRGTVTDEHVALTAAFRQLDYLAVVTPTVGDNGLNHLSQLARLDTLFLSDSAITDTTLTQLSSLPRLEHLYLNRTQITDAGLKRLSGLSTLKTLSLIGTQVTDAGVRDVAGLKHLNTLELSGTRVTDDCLQHIVTHEGLQVLDLSNTNITGTQLSVLRELTELKELKLRDNQISADHVPVIADFNSLTHLDLRGTRLTRADVADLKLSLPKLHVSLTPNEPAAADAFRKYLANQPLKALPSGSHTSLQTNAAVDHPTPVVRPANQRFASENIHKRPDFQRHIVPLLGRLGCNGRICHGSFQGQGGFSLSMFGYDFDADLTALTLGEHPRVDIQNVENSLILNKPASAEEHGGGQRFKKGGWEYQLLKRWIADGAQGVKNGPQKLAAFEVVPAEIVFDHIGQTVQLKCIAVWEDGVREDVTPLARFQTNDEAMATVSADGLVTCRSPGDTHVVTFYDNGIASTQVLMPVSNMAGDRFPAFAAPTETDRLVLRKLSLLGIEPSPVCSDDEFLRRVSLDLTGTLPSADEVRSFRADTSPDKRDRKIDDLLKTDAYATWWGMKLSDLTGSNSQSLGTTDMNTPAADQWNAWLKRRVADNVGWNHIAAGIILATSRRPDQTYEDYVAEQSRHLKTKDGTDFTSLDNPMHYYWFRSNNQTESDRAITFGYTFLGIRLQCAQCHKHPFDQWSKDDFDRFSAVFRRIQTGIAPDAKVSQDALKTQLGVPSKLDTAALRRQMYLRVSAEGLPIPWNEVYLGPPSNVPTPARFPAGDEFDLNEFADPREPLFAWLIEPDHPYFAPSFVNRIWAHHFGVGIVDPPDDFNMANPPSNKALLSWLADQFIRHGFDMRWLHCTILTSHTYQRSSAVRESNRSDDRNFSHALVRRLPAEVTMDAILRATARDDVASGYPDHTNTRKIAQHPKSYQARGIDYSLLVFGKPRRTTSCDCERQDQPTLLQSLYVRNDTETIGWLERSDGWLQSIAGELKQTLPSDLKPNEFAVAAEFADDERTAALVQNAYLRTVNRDATADELRIALQHISKSRNTIDGLRDVLWALLNTQEFLTNH